VAGLAHRRHSPHRRSGEPSPRSRRRAPLTFALILVAGYSGTPLPKKLGIAEGSRVSLVGAPDGFEALLGPLPPAVRFETPRSTALDLVLLFTERAAELERRFARQVERLDTAGMLWVAWPKKASRRPTDLTEDVVRRIGLDAGLVDVKVCAIDEVWSGLKFVRRLRDR
jgi:hypothetical protein